MEPIIEFKDYSFKYRSQVEPTLLDINLSIYPGEKVLIVGPSGSGKSTLAHCINGLVPFSFTGESTGSLKIEGQEPKELGLFGLSKLVGTVLQDTDGQFIGLTVAEDVAFSMENDCIAQDEMFERVDRVAKTVDITDLLDHAPNALSGGQKQRVSMAGVIVDDVDILLFDEPLANLDPATGKRAIDLIDRIHKKNNTTILIIEHRDELDLLGKMDPLSVHADDQIPRLHSRFLCRIIRYQFLHDRAVGIAVCRDNHSKHIRQNKIKEWSCHNRTDTRPDTRIGKCALRQFPR